MCHLLFKFIMRLLSDYWEIKMLLSHCWRLLTWYKSRNLLSSSRMLKIFNLKESLQFNKEFIKQVIHCKEANLKTSHLHISLSHHFFSWTLISAANLIKITISWPFSCYRMKVLLGAQFFVLMRFSVLIWDWLEK